MNINLIFLLFTDNEESSKISAFLSLPFLMASSISRGKKSNTQWRTSKLKVRNGFIIHAKSNAEVQKTITRRREKFIGLGHYNIWSYFKQYFKLFYCY
jgi:hypothetical protein